MVLWQKSIKRVKLIKLTSHFDTVDTFYVCCLVPLEFFLQTQPNPSFYLIQESKYCRVRLSFAIGNEQGQQIMQHWNAYPPTSNCILSNITGKCKYMGM